MITKLRGELIASCTECGGEFAGGVEDDFRAFVEELKAAGWMIRQYQGEWEHFCPDCVEGHQ